MYSLLRNLPNIFGGDSETFRNQHDEGTEIQERYWKLYKRRHYTCRYQMNTYDAQLDISIPMALCKQIIYDYSIQKH